MNKHKIDEKEYFLCEDYEKIINSEVDTRLMFKLDEVIESIKNIAKTNYHISFHQHSQKHQHYWECFNQLNDIIKKEKVIKVPYNDMYEKKLDKIFDKYINEFSDKLLKRGTQEYYYKQKQIVNILDRFYSDIWNS